MKTTRKSNCCGAPPFGILGVSEVGLCSKCKESAVFPTTKRNRRVKVRAIGSVSRTWTVSEKKLDEVLEQAAQMAKESGLKVEVLFSWDKGLTWQTPEGIRVRGNNECASSGDLADKVAKAIESRAKRTGWVWPRSSIDKLVRPIIQDHLSEIH